MLIYYNLYKLPYYIIYLPSPKVSIFPGFVACYKFTRSLSIMLKHENKMYYFTIFYFDGNINENDYSL